MTEVNIEKQLAKICGNDIIKQAKSLLKQSALLGAWRDDEKFIHGKFHLVDRSPVECKIKNIKNNQYDCTCSKKGKSLCEHVTALAIHAEKFKQKNSVKEEPSSYYGGLKSKTLPDLLNGSLYKHSAQIFIEVISAFPHVPSKWENAVISVKIINEKREYLGNLNNLRHIYFDKKLSTTLSFDDFSLQDQQIIRFLALNGEADNSKILLNSEITTEFFFCLINFPRFMRNGIFLQVRGEFAQAVLIRTKDKNKVVFAPGIQVGEAILPTAGAKVITGRSGCWIGREGEYFFVPASCEISWLRNFFRASVQELEEFRSDKNPNGFPLKTVDKETLELIKPKPSIFLDGDIEKDGGLRLYVSYLYEEQNRKIVLHSDGGRLFKDGSSFFKRDNSFEFDFEQELLLFGFERRSSYFRLNTTEKCGMFLDRILPDWAKKRAYLNFSSDLCKLFNTAYGANLVELNLQLVKSENDFHRISYKISAEDNIIDWQSCIQATSQKEEFIYINKVGPVRIPPALQTFFTGISSIVRSINTDERTFDLPLYSTDFFVNLTKDIPGALILELVSCNIPDSEMQNSSGFFDFKGELREYQKQGVRYLQWMTDRKLNAILADEMGLGKTVQLLAFLASRKQKKSQCALVICPASLIVNWMRETEKFIPKFKVCAPLGSERKEKLKDIGKFDLLILSYAAARLSAEQLRSYNFSYLILDEAQHIKNHGSSNAKNCKNIKANSKIVLTGTPLENSPEDLWSIFDFLQPNMLGSLKEFRTRYSNTSEDIEMREELANRISPFIKRRTKIMAAPDLPPKREQVIYCTMEQEQRELYNKIKLEGQNKLANTDGIQTYMTIFQTLLKLRQVCCHPALIPNGEGANIPSAKLELLMELLNEHIDSNHKMLLFSQFTSLLALIKPELETEKIPYEYLDGSTKNRQQRVDNFNNDINIPLFLLSLKAGGTGLNLTSADTVIIYDPWWNPAIEMQATDRSHRIGQLRPVSSIKLVVKDSIEEKILEMQKSKQEIFNNVIENPALAQSELSLDELKKLLD